MGEGLREQREKAFSSPKCWVPHLQPHFHHCLLQGPGWGTSMGTAYLDHEEVSQLLEGRRFLQTAELCLCGKLINRWVIAQ